MNNEIDTDLIPHQTVTAIVENVDKAREEVRQGFALIVTAKKRLHSALGDSNYYDHIIKSSLSDYSFSDNEVVEESLRLITQNAWRYILEQTGLTKFMTDKRRHELEAQIDGDQLPPLTVENIMGTLQGISGKINGLLEECIKEVFDWLRPQQDWGVGALKTNNKFKVGQKVIVGWVVEHGYHSAKYQFQWGVEQRFTSLANAFSLLDGKGMQQSPHDFVTRCKVAMSGGAETFEDEYFRCKFYGNGNMHIAFKRPDLLAQLNRVGGGEGIPEQDIRTKKEQEKTAVVPTQN